MYETYWNLTANPFRATPALEWFHESPAHEEALSRLFFVIEARRGCGLLRGPAGTGKSLTLQVLVREARLSQRSGGLIDLAGLCGMEVLTRLAELLGLPMFAALRVTEQLWIEIEDCLTATRLSAGETVVALDSLDEVTPDAATAVERLLRLANRRPDVITLLAARRTPVLLHGRDGHAQSLQRSFDELSDVRIELPPLTSEETRQHVNELLARAGAERPLFAQPALDKLHNVTGGVPRWINRLCDLCLLAAMHAGQRLVDAAGVRQAADELGLPADIPRHRSTAERMSAAKLRSATLGAW